MESLDEIEIWIEHRSVSEYNDVMNRISECDNLEPSNISVNIGSYTCFGLVSKHAGSEAGRECQQKFAHLPLRIEMGGPNADDRSTDDYEDTQIAGFKDTMSSEPMFRSSAFRGSPLSSGDMKTVDPIQFHPKMLGISLSNGDIQLG